MEDKTQKRQKNSKKVTNEEKERINDQIQTLRRSIAALLAENDMFEHCIRRLDPGDLVSQVPEEGPGAAGASQLEGGGLGGKSQANMSDPPLQLTLEEKLDLVKREVTETRQDLMKLRQEQRYGGNEDNYKASLQMAELHLRNIRSARKEFERRFLQPNKEVKPEMEPDKVLSYIADRSKTQLGQFKMRYQALKAKEKRLQQQLQQKGEMGKVEYEDIFQDCSEQKNDKNLDELQLKNLKVQHNLSSHKKMLQEVMLESTELSNDITKRKQMLEKIEMDLQHVEEERLKANALNQYLHRQMADYQVPDISEYMHVKEKHKKLQKSIRTWEGKARIAAMASKTHAKARHKQRATLTPANSVVAGASSVEIPVKLPDIVGRSTKRSGGTPDSSQDTRVLNHSHDLN